MYRIFIKYCGFFAIGCTIGVTVHSHCVESFEGLLLRCRGEEGVAVNCENTLYLTIHLSVCLSVYVDISPIKTLLSVKSLPWIILDVWAGGNRHIQVYAKLQFIQPNVLIKSMSIRYIIYCSQDRLVFTHCFKTDGQCRTQQSIEVAPRITHYIRILVKYRMLKKTLILSTFVPFFHSLSLILEHLVINKNDSRSEGGN